MASSPVGQQKQQQQQQQQPKGILKEPSSEAGSECGGAGSTPHTPKHLCWDEEKLAITEAGKGACTIHINEPKTPFVPLSDPRRNFTESEDDEFQLERISGSVSDAGSNSSSKCPTSGSEWDEELSEHEEFLAKRRESYRMKGAMTLGRKLLEDEDEDEN